MTHQDKPLPDDVRRYFAVRINRALRSQADHELRKEIDKISNDDISPREALLFTAAVVVGFVVLLLLFIGVSGFITGRF
ncbi:MAG: hypothetical protein AAF384_09690 [Pseudomonadota bacterium]